MIEMEDQTIRRTYNRISRNLKDRRSKGLVSDSVILTILKTSNKTYKPAFEESHIRGKRISKEKKEELLSRDLIRETNKTKEYALTAKAIVRHEVDENKLSWEKFGKYIDKFLNFYEDSVSSLTAKEKVIITAMIGVRSFSENSWLNLSNEEVRQRWKKVLEDTARKLSELGIVDIQPSDLWGKTSGRNEILLLHNRRNKNLRNKTKRIYNDSGSSEYYLQLDDKTKKQDIEFLLNKVIGDCTLKHDELEDLKEYLQETASRESIRIFDSSHKFADSTHDKIIWDVVMDL